jgi:hypothetical protein
MLKFVLVLSCTFSIVLNFSCRRSPDACVDKSAVSAIVRETVRITACNSSATAYLWTLDNQFLTLFDSSTASTFLFDYYVVSGGRRCDNYVELGFLSTGTFDLGLKDPIVRSGVCAGGSIEYRRSDEVSVPITISQ